MKIVVFSDSHGKDALMRRIMLRHRDAYFFHLGDGAPSFLSLCRDMTLPGFAVRGNCDFFEGEFPLEPTQVVTLEGYRFFLTHGHAYGVKGGFCGRLARAAREAGCQVALFGHTHLRLNRYLSGTEGEAPLYLFNPGSISQPREGGPSYGVIEIVKGQLLLNLAEVYPER